MLYHVSEFIVFVLFLPVFMNIILPLGMLVGWILRRALKLVLEGKPRDAEEAELPAQSFLAR